MSDDITLKEFYDLKTEVAVLKAQREGSEKALSLANNILNTYQETWSKTVAMLKESRDQSQGKSLGHNGAWLIAVPTIGWGLTVLYMLTRGH